MEPVVSRDWEIIRIFLILAILTVGFVWGIQGLILTPAPQSQNHQNKSMSRGFEKTDTVFQGLIILPESMNRSAIPLREPASP